MRGRTGPLVKGRVPVGLALRRSSGHVRGGGRPGGHRVRGVVFYADSRSTRSSSPSSRVCRRCWEVRAMSDSRLPNYSPLRETAGTAAAKVDCRVRRDPGDGLAVRNADRFAARHRRPPVGSAVSTEWRTRRRPAARARWSQSTWRNSAPHSRPPAGHGRPSRSRRRRLGTTESHRAAVASLRSSWASA
jgi:hypothetical protein